MIDKGKIVGTITKTEFMHKKKEDEDKEKLIVEENEMVTMKKNETE